MRQRMIGMALFLVALGLAASVPQAQATTITQTRYLGSDIITWNGYYMLRNQTDIDTFNLAYYNYSHAYDGNIQVGFQAWRCIVNSLGYYALQIQYEELTSGTTLLWEKANNFEGWATTTWTSPDLNLSRLDFLEVWFRARFKIGTTLWSSWYTLSYGAGQADYITEHLCMDSLISSAWNFTLYLKCWRETVPTNKRIVQIYFGNSTYDSRVENMQFDNGTLIEENNMLPVGFLLATLIILPIGILIAKKR